MTRQKSFKSRVRARMTKTGESYTTARRHLLGRTEPVSDVASPTPESPTAMERKVTDPLMRDRTGRGWHEWFDLLDAWDGTTVRHTEIASWLVSEQQVDGWWAQTIAVGYEQARGIRVPGQSSTGVFGANVTRTVGVPVTRLFEAFADDSVRARWLPDAKLRVRTATAPKSFRADWGGGESRLVVEFTPKSEAKAQVSVLHEKLADADAVAALKVYWRERLTALKQLLEA